MRASHHRYNSEDHLDVSGSPGFISLRYAARIAIEESGPPRDAFASMSKRRARSLANMPVGAYISQVTKYRGKIKFIK